MTYSKADFDDNMTPAILDTMTGKDMDELRVEFEEAHISPAGWGLMRVAEKRSWLKRNLAEFRAKVTKAEPGPAEREKALWDANKHSQTYLRRKHGSFVSKPRVIAAMASNRNALTEAIAKDAKLSRQAMRQAGRKGLGYLVA